MKQLLLLFFAIILISSTNNAQTIKTLPNGDFETWDSISYNDLISPWVTSNPGCIAVTGNPNVTKVSGFSGQAVHLQTYIVNSDTLAGEISNILGYPIGVPYTQTPTGIKGYYRCNMVGHDTGFLAIGFISGGNIFYSKYIPFYGNISGFTAFSDTMNLPFAPDTMIIAAVSSNLQNNVGVSAGSWLELDELSFTGTGITQQIGDGNFESWTTKSDDVPVGWHVAPSFTAVGSGGVSRSTDHYSGNYSVKIVEAPFSTTTQLTNGKFDQNGNISGGLPYHVQSDTLTGYYKYSTLGSDSGGLAAYFIGNDSLISFSTHFFLPSASWKYFEMPISVASIPDTMRLDIVSSVNYLDSTGNSTLYLDDLQLKSQPHTSGIFNTEKPSLAMTAFPDPVQNQLNIRFENAVPPECNVKIYNLEGRLMMENEFNSGSAMISLAIGQLSKGLYFYEVVANGYAICNKFVKGN